MTYLDTLLGWAFFVCACIPIVLGPWLFGAAEAWWFWPFVTVIFLASGFLAVRMLLRPLSALPVGGLRSLVGLGARWPSLLAAGLALFLLYAFCRALLTPVRMTAEKSFLLLLTPCLLGVGLVLGGRRRQLRILFAIVLGNLGLLGLYGVVNHLVTDSHWVLWMPGYSQYFAEHRATGTFFCPDHFSGAMELAFCLAVGLLLDRRTARPAKLGATFLSILSLAGIVMSKSRGGGLAVLVVAAAAMTWGLAQRRRVKRWTWRIAAVAAVLAGILAVLCFGGGYAQRFSACFRWDTIRHLPPREAVRELRRTMAEDARGRMWGAALRAWSTSRTFGVGAGMHQNLWPHFAATADGDREAGIPPSQFNNEWYSYETHNDWLQLLEEYGAVGLALFLLPFLALAAGLRAGLRTRTEREDAAGTGHGGGESPIGSFGLVLGGFLALVAMAFHSFGDFNLQMPGTSWTLAAILAIAVVHTRVFESRCGGGRA